MNTQSITDQKIASSKGEIILYQTADGRTNIDVKLENDTVWLTQTQMSLLFDKDQSVIARHIKNALDEGEIDESNMQKMHNTFSKYKPTTIYNLDVILYAPDGHKRIADNALVALTLMIAESKTDEMDTMVKVIVNLINGDNR